jgi:hypothetical protein
VSENDKAAAVRQQLAAAGVKCERPGCSAQATGARKVGKTMPYLCDDHLADPAAAAVAEQRLRDAEHRGRYPNGLTMQEWLNLED